MVDKNNYQETIHINIGTYILIIIILYHSILLLIVIKKFQK